MDDNFAEKNNKLLYSIGEVAEMFDVNVSHIRHWSNYFDILKPKTNKKGNRFYKKEDIENIKIIYNLVKDKGMHLEAAQRQMKKNRMGLQKNVVVVQKLMDVKSLLAEVLLALDDEKEDIVIYKNSEK